MLPNIKSPQLSKPEASGTQTPSWTEWRKKTWEKPGWPPGASSPLVNTVFCCN